MALKKVVATFLVDEEKLLSFYDGLGGIDNLHDALNSEFGWLEESGISMDDWRVVNGDLKKSFDDLMRKDRY